mmetsp:Transcript_43206/g.138884  ORF Transcript_43206/g.138884 Transcript_43206/m.138884 type:complete len:155 (+) Transcript_43206:94-558(+)
MFKCVACCTEEAKDAEIAPLPKGAAEPPPPPKAAPNRDIEVPAQDPPKEASAAPRPELSSWHFAVTVSKGDGSKIGLDTVARQTHFEGPSLKIKKLKDGLIEMYNAAQPDEEKKVVAGDYIIEVNGLRGNTDELYKVIGSSHVVNLVISRPPKS